MAQQGLVKLQAGLAVPLPALVSRLNVYICHHVEYNTQLFACSAFDHIYLSMQLLIVAHLVSLTMEDCVHFQELPL